MPNNKPINTDTPKATTIEVAVTTVGHSAMLAIISDSSKACSDSDQTPSDRNENRLDQELADNIPLPRSDRTTNPDLARALEHGGQHDIHDPDTPDEQRYALRCKS